MQVPLQTKMQCTSLCPPTGGLSHRVVLNYLHRLRRGVFVNVQTRNCHLSNIRQWYQGTCKLSTFSARTPFYWVVDATLGEGREFLNISSPAVLASPQRLWYFVAVGIDMLEPAAILKFAYPIFAERIQLSEKRKRWRNGQRCGLELSRASNTRSPWR